MQWRKGGAGCGGRPLTAPRLRRRRGPSFPSRPDGGLSPFRFWCEISRRRRFFLFLAYFSSLRQSLPGSRISRILPFSEISARPRFAASTVRRFNSLIRMPVAQTASMSRAKRSLPRAEAVETRRSYSFFVSSRRPSRNRRRWIFRNFSRHSSQPRKRNRPLSAESMAFTETGA